MWQSGAYKGIKNTQITEEDKRDLEELGIISLEENKTVIGEFIEIAKKLSIEGIEVGKLTQSRRINENGKKSQVKNTIKDLVEQGEIPRELLGKLGLEEEYRIGHYIEVAKRSV